MNDVGNGCTDTTNTVGECHTLCKNTNECEYFSWLGFSIPGREKQCCLKGNSINPIQLTGSVSGPKHCGNTLL